MIYKRPDFGINFWSKPEHLKAMFAIGMIEKYIYVEYKLFNLFDIST
jgi:hypothetical protein